MAKVKRHVSTKRRSFEYSRHVSIDEHKVFPYISEADWEESQDNEKELEWLDERGKKRFLKLKERYSLEVNRKTKLSPDTDELRIVLLGKTGVGKSATGNTILGENSFNDSKKPSSVTQVATKRVRSINGRVVCVMDTPGFFDTKRSEDAIFKEIARVMKEFSAGVHAFVYVLDMTNPRFTLENKETLEMIEKRFGGDIKSFRLLVYSKAEFLTETSNLDQFCEVQMADDKEPIAQFLRELGWRVVAVNNKTTIPAERKRNQDVILSMIEKLKNENKDAVYTNEMFQHAMKKRQELQEKGVTLGWNPEIMEAVDVIVAADPSISQDEDKLTECVRRHLEQKKREISNALKVAKQINEQEQASIINEEDTENDDEDTDEDPDEEKYVPITEQIQKFQSVINNAESAKKMGNKKAEDLENDESKTEAEPCHTAGDKLLKDALHEDQWLPSGGEIGRVPMADYRSKENFKEKRVRWQREQKKQEQTFQTEELEIRTDVLKKSETEKGKMLDELEKVNQATREETKIQQLENELAQERKDKFLLLQRQKEIRNQDREEARKEREQLIEENKLRLQLTNDALHNANMATQANEIARENDATVRSIMDMIRSPISTLFSKLWYE